eukprot:6199234-Pleurochrysis_carterae.AAC.2
MHSIWRAEDLNVQHHGVRLHREVRLSGHLLRAHTNGGGENTQRPPFGPVTIVLPPIRAGQYEFKECLMPCSEAENVKKSSPCKEPYGAVYMVGQQPGRAPGGGGGSNSRQRSHELYIRYLWYLYPRES